MNPIEQAIEALLTGAAMCAEGTSMRKEIEEAITSLRSLQKEVEGVEPVATLYVSMETHDMGQSLAPNPPFKFAQAKAHQQAKDLPIGEYALYTADQLRTAVAAALGRGAAAQPGWTAEEIEEVIACLDDDAVTLLDVNPEDERAVNMQRAAAMIQVFAESLSAAPSPEATQPTQAEAPSEREEIIAPHPALQRALFCYATGTDGAIAILLRGWDALVEKIEEEVGCHPDLKWRDILADLDDWQDDGWGVPHKYTSDFEDGYMSIYTVSEDRQDAALATQQAGQGEAAWRTSVEVKARLRAAAQEPPKHSNFHNRARPDGDIWRTVLLSDLRELLKHAGWLATPPAPQQPEALAQQERDREDAQRWRIVEAAGGDVTLRLHNARPGTRRSLIDAIRAARSSDGGA